VAGFDFGMVTTGTQDQTQIVDESSDGVNQMRHFVQQDKFNIFRLPTGWQYITNNQIGGNLDSTNFGKYNTLVQGCLSLEALCIVDIHNYAR
jgi:endoglucanase